MRREDKKTDGQDNTKKKHTHQVTFKCATFVQNVALVLVCHACKEERGREKGKKEKGRPGLIIRSSVYNIGKKKRAQSCRQHSIQ